MNSPDWNHIRAFLATADSGSLSAAARKLGLTQPTLSRQVAALETELGLLLFERVGRSLELTQAGRELLDHSRTMGQAAQALSLSATGQAQSIDGTIRITASDMMSAYVLPEVLQQLQRRAPRLTIDVVATNDIRDLMRREADIAIRHVRPDQPDLIARLVQEASGHFYASRGYLDKRGRPERYSDLADHDFVSFGDTDRMIEYLVPMGIPVTAEQFRIGSSSGLVAWELVKQGFGITPMSDDVAAKCPEVERVLQDAGPITFPIWLTTHRELHTSRRIRLVYDMLAEFFAAK
ncbi:LysR family transcriptional regulator [Phaeobacter italicus]|uniref:LysR family transcriptional regulator n=1 Tax=Phaeobacter italicus TaxID=481446 RepID=UPI000186F707|nr:LysR family transcriptional regulator [Phaeobacter italicus]EEB71109.1 transcriptional regulator, LysR family [Ruegeria sp. R11]CRL13195.1 Cat operon transcriptional regulator [Phaeobacter italicus]SFH38545.1 transcriptional regulator, LysR family [Phaeobacter italicus]